MELRSSVQYEVRRNGVREWRMEDERCCAKNKDLGGGVKRAQSSIELDSSSYRINL